MEELRLWIARKLDLEPHELADVDDLVGLGMDSVTTMTMVGSWRRAGASVTYRDLAVNPTLSGWWAALSTHTGPPPEPQSETATPIDPEAPFPLTPVQHAYWMGRKDGQVLGGVGCHGYFEFDGPGADCDRLDRAVRALVARHGMLRVVVLDDGRQQITSDSPWPGLTCHDLRVLSPDAAEERLAAIREELSHRLLDIRAGEVFDVQLSLLPGGGARLHLNVDLIVADVMSIQVLMADLAVLYRGGELPPLSLSFPVYLSDVTARRAEEREHARAYWQQRADRVRVGGPRLPLATDPARISRPRFRRRTHLIEQALFDRLKDRARAYRVTPSMVMATAFADILGRWSSDQRFLLNVPLFDRQSGHPDVEHMVADFTNLILLEVETGGGRTFAERVRAVQERFQEDVTHSAYSAVEVMRDIGRDQHGSGPISAPVVFASSIGGQFVDEGFREQFGEMSWMVSQTPQVWLDHQLYETPGGLLLTWDSVDALFPEGVVDAMFEAYTDLVRHLAAGHTEPARAWDHPTPRPLPADQARRREAVNATAADIPEGLLHDGVVAQARRTPGRTAVIAANGSLTYGELLGRAASVAGLLRERCTSGEVVAISMSKGWEQVAGTLGTLMAGCAYLPLDTAQPAARRNRILADAGVRQVLVRSGDTDPEDWPDPVTVTVVDGLQPVPEHHQTHRPGPDDLAYVIYTSGSTGAPKGVMISHASALNTVSDINSRYGVEPGDRVLGLASLSFDLSVYDIFGPLARGGALVLPDPDRRGDPTHWAALIQEHRITLWNSVPAQLQMLDDCLGPQYSTPDQETEWNLSCLRLALLSGDWIPVTLPDSIRAKLPNLRVISLGGATEAAIWSIHHPIETVGVDWSSIPYGKPLANQTFHVLDPDLCPCPDWVPGELFIGGAGLALGYLGDPQRTAERFFTHPVTGERLYRTGDLGRYLPDSTIEFLGRADSQVKVRGHRVELGEIESALERHPSVGAACVLADGDRADRRLVALVTGRRRTPEGAPITAIAAAAHSAGRDAAEAVDPVRANEFQASLDEAVVVTLEHALREMGAFTTAGQAHTTDEVLRLTRAVPRHQWIVRRWLGILRGAGRLIHDPESDLHRAAEGRPLAGHQDVEAAWQLVRDVHARGHDQWSAEAIDLFRRSGARLPELVRGDQDEVHLLFPEGSTDTAVSLFTDSLIARYTNAATAGALREIALRRTEGNGPLRVLEVGAGVGGTSADAFEALADLDVEYLFTDVSPYFLNGARRRFAAIPFVDYGLFDMNVDYRPQGLAPNSFDVIVAANVLHNAENAVKMLGRLRQLLTPGGWLLFTEPTRESLELMIFMAFLIDVGAEGVGFTDVRRGQDRMLLSRDEWWDALRQAGATDQWQLPEEPGHAADPLPRSLGQRLLAARFKADQARVDTHELSAHLTDNLPVYMVPTRIYVLDSLPLTANGKVDRTALRAWLSTASDPAAIRQEVTQPRDALEKQLADLWAEVLNIPHQIGADQDFLTIGGDSLLATQLVSTVRERVPQAAGKRFDTLLHCMIEHRTVSALAAVIRQEPAENDEDPSR
ncbi:amino acid adenylation domain-containing protein [Streptomyces sp. 5-6(2022)]|uniref:amino acid adenylation domain-containing protein n=1 Tax=Streptomyces sp. 5-6(2022) TaxID=2936510 RepID=UPI0031BBB38E